MSTSSLHWTLLVLFCVLFVKWSMFPSIHIVPPKNHSFLFPLEPFWLTLSLVIASKIKNHPKSVFQLSSIQGSISLKLGAWCRTEIVIFRRALGVHSTQILVKIYNTQQLGYLRSGPETETRND